MMTSCENSTTKSSPSFPEEEEIEGMDDPEILAHNDENYSDKDHESPLERTLILMHNNHDNLTSEDCGALDDETTSAANLDRNHSSPPKSSPSFPEEEENEPMEDALTQREDDDDIEHTLMMMKTESNKLITPLGASGADKKIHWSSRQVHVLLDCVEGRLDQFRNRGVHANVWTKIGEEMAALFPLITTKHCYNKWKNLRRDVRLSLVNPNKSVRNAGVLERVARLVAEIYPNGSELSLPPVTPLPTLPDSIISPKKISNSTLKKKGAGKTARHPKLTSKHIARQQQLEEQQVKNEDCMKDEIGISSMASPISPPNLPPEMNFPSLLSAAANSLIQDFKGRQSPAPSGNCQQNLLPLLVNPFVMNPHLFSGLVAAHNMKQQTGFSTTSDEEADSFPLTSHEEDSPHDLSRKVGPHLWTQQHQHQDSELLEMLRNFHAEETQHAKVIEQMVGMAMDLKSAACRRLSALDDLLMAFARKHSDDAFI